MKISKKTKDEIINRYISSDITLSELKKIYNVSINAIREWLKKRNILIRISNTRFKRKYTLDENYFNEINTEDKAYFLGFMYADGYNNEKIGCVILELADIDILENFNRYLKSNKPIKIYKQKNIYNKKLNKYYISKDKNCIQINSFKISKSLARLGCWQKKSLNLKFPTEEQVPRYLMKHFIRGYMDGDGCFYYYHMQKKFWRISCDIMSSNDFCEDLHKFLKNELNIVTGFAKDKRHSSTTKSVKISSNERAIKFLNWIYSDATVFLKRKYDKYLKIKGLLNEKSFTC